MNTKDKMWPLWVLLGAIPGMILWIMLVRIQFAGEYAGLLMGLGAIALYRWQGSKLKISRLVIGSVILVCMCLIINHLSYATDIYYSFAEGFYGEAGASFSFADSVKTVYTSFVVNNSDNMRAFYLEAFIQGSLCALVFFIGFFIYYREMDKIDAEEALKRSEKEKE